MQLTSLSLALTRAGLLSAWSPASLFANSEPGVWYDPSDLTTLFQDAAGTTPVTAVEQPVGLMLDKSQGLVLGPELVTNGTFDVDTTGWTAYTNTAQAATISAVSGALRVTTGESQGAQGARQFLTGLTVGKWYKATAKIRKVTDPSSNLGTANLRFGNGDVTSGWVASFSTTSTSYVDATIYFSPTGTTGTIGLVSGGTATTVSTYVMEYDNISVRELPGNHAFQTTSTKRPVLSRRVNLLTKTEQFDDGAWTKDAATVTATSAPDSTNTAWTITGNGTNAIHSVRQGYSYVGGRTFVFIARAGTNNFLQVFTDGTSNEFANFNLSTGAIGSLGSDSSGASITAYGGGWFVCSVTFAVSNATTHVRFALVTSSTAARAEANTLATTVLVWRPSLVPSDQASIPYQRVNTATDYDADPTKFPAYLKGDSVSGRAMVTNTITPGTDKVQVFAGVRKLSDAAAGVVAELSDAAGPNNGAFAVSAPASNSPTYGFFSRGSVSPAVASVASGFNAPTSNVIACIGNIAADTQIIRVNGSQYAPITNDQGTGNYLAYPLYLFARNQSSLYFTGHLYSLLVRFGPNLPTATIEQAERFVAQKTGITI